MAKLNRELGARAPRKKQINLIKKEVQSVDIGKRIVSIVAVLAILLAAGGYGYLRWDTVNGLRRQAGQLQDELANLKIISASYDEINAEYVRYSTAYETLAESKTHDCRDLLDKVRERVEPYGYITNVVTDGNTMQIVVYCRDSAEVTDSLYNDPDKLVSMVVMNKEVRMKDAKIFGVQVTGGQTGEEEPEAGETAEGETELDPLVADALLVDPKLLVESIAYMTLYFVDKEG